MTKTQLNKITAIAKRIMKSDKNDFRKRKEEIDGKICVTDGYRAIIFNCPIDLPDDEREDKRSGSYASVITTYMDDCRKNYREVLKIPTADDIKATMKAMKEQYVDIPTKFIDEWLLGQTEDGHKILVDPKFLLDMVEALPGCTCYSSGEYKKPVYFKADNGEGFLMPRFDSLLGGYHIRRIHGRLEWEELPRETDSWTCKTSKVSEQA